MINTPPKNWEPVLVGDLATLIRGVSYKKADARNSEATGFKAILRANNISDSINLDELVFVSEDLVSTDQHLQEGDILFAMSSGSRNLVGKSARINRDLECGFGAFCGALRPSSLVSNTYLSLIFRGREFRHAISEIAKGSNINNLKREHILGYKIPLPPLAEQKRIVAKIEELFSELDAGVESLRQARAQLGVYRQALLKKAFSGKLTETWRQQNVDKLEPAEVLINSLQSKKERPVVASTSRKHNVEQWSWATLDQLTEYITSGSRGWAKFYSNSGSVFIRAQNLNRDRLDISDIAYVSLPTKAEGKRTKVRKGDLLITITGANVTKAGIVDLDFDDAYVSQHVALCRILDTRLSEYVFRYVVAQGGGRKDLEELAYGAGKPGLNLNNLRSLEIPIPPVGEIPEIVRILDEQFEAIEQNEREIDAALERAEALRQSILKKAFSGQLVEQDPNDEPASVLLERIRTEREKAAALKPSKKRAKKKAKKRSRKNNTPLQSELSL